MSFTPAPLTESTGGMPLHEWLKKIETQERYSASMTELENLQDGTSEPDADYSHLAPGVTPFDAAAYLPSTMRESAGWQQLGRALTDLQRQRAQAQTTLRLLHYVTPDASETQLKHLAAALGHPYESELSPYAVTMLALPGQLARWREVTGTDEWHRFVSYFLGADLQVKNLYTNDYKRFFPKPLGELVVNGGSWYRTTHVDLTVNFRQLRFSLKPRSNQTLYDRALELIKQYIPITLRVHSLALMEQLPVDGTGLVLYSRIVTGGGAICKSPLQKTHLWEN